MNLLQILAQCNDKRITIITRNKIEAKLVFDCLVFNKATFLGLNKLLLNEIIITVITIDEIIQYCNSIKNTLFLIEFPELIPSHVLNKIQMNFNSVLAAEII
jgi:hypothetical protein